MSSKESSVKQVGVFGAGPAGIAATKRLSELGHEVTWIMPEKYVNRRSIYTATDKYPSLNDVVGAEDRVYVPYVRLVNDTGADVSINVDGNPYFMVDNMKITIDAVTDAQKKGVNVEKITRKDVRNLHIVEEEEFVNIELSGGSKKFDSVVDATGVNASIIRQVDKSRLANEGDFLVMYLFGGKIKGSLDSPDMILATGGDIGTSWVCPSIDKGYIDIVFGSWSPFNDSTKFFGSAKQRFTKLLDFAKSLKGVHVEADKLSEFYHGMLRAQPMSAPMTNRVFAVGEAAGVGEPSTGRVFDRSYHSGMLVAEAIDNNQSPKEFYKLWRKIWKDDLLFAGTMARLPFQLAKKVGGSFTLLDELSKSGLQDKVIKNAINWFVYHKLSPEAIMYLLNNPKLLNPFAISLMKFAELRLKGVNKRSGLVWSLPNVKED